MPPEAERFGAKRAGATVVEIESASHAVALSQSRAVAELNPRRGPRDQLSRLRERPRGRLPLPHHVHAVPPALRADGGRFS
ncbi:hypothetical protein AB0L35_10255 [Streptomyces sp. NPDC052309]|uniref:hypothetical protein n=1 Tax=Streptomyces sp. NPDC052309 TaxID=3155421 RepID=UPI00342A9797